METFTIVDGIVVSLVSIVMVFLVLFSLQLVLQLFKGFSKNTAKDLTIDTENNEPERRSSVNLEDEGDSEMVAALMALILANGDQQDKKYQVTKIKRIR